MDGATDIAAPTAVSGARRLGRRIVGLVLGLALPTGFLSWVFGFDALKERINGALWCSDSDATDFDVQITSSGSKTLTTDTLVCRKEGGVVRTVGEGKMLIGIVGTAFVVSLLLLGLLVLVLWTFSKLRRRPARVIVGS